jgi:hypothetical protein
VKNGSQNIRWQSRRSYRKTRERLKRRIRNKAKLPNHIIVKYNLKKVQTFIRFELYEKHRIVEETLRINVPETLCLIDDQEATYEFISNAEHYLSYEKPYNIYIDHSGTQKIGLAASYIFDERLKNYIKFWRNKGYHIALRGNISNNKEVNNFLLSFGFLSEIKHNSNFDKDSVDYDYQNKFVTLKFPGSRDKEHLKGNASSGLADYFRSCFDHNGLYLTPDGHAMLTEAFGEIIGNAEEHNLKDVSKWYALGCYNKDTNLCSFAIINHGSTIYESLSDKESTSNEVLQEVNRVINSNRSFIKGLTSKQENDEETVWNVMALQDGISSKRTRHGKASTRGQGLMDVIEFVGELKKSNDVGRIAIISGKSKILIDYTYPIVNNVVNVAGEKRRQIIFNNENSLYSPQDPSKVVLMNGQYQGTIITGQLKINTQFITEKVERTNGR